MWKHPYFGSDGFANLLGVVSAVTASCQFLLQHYFVSVKDLSFAQTLVINEGGLSIFTFLFTILCSPKRRRDCGNSIRLLLSDKYVLLGAASRSLAGTLYGFFAIISTKWLSPGDALAFIIIGCHFWNITLSKIFFNDIKISRLIMFMLFISVIGIILICQPSFIFKNSQYGTSQYISMVFAILCALTWAVGNIISKKFKDIDWNLFLIVDGTLCTFISLLFWVINIIVSDNAIGYLEYGKENLTNTVVLNIFFFLFLGFTVWLYVATRIYSFQIGNIIRLEFIVCIKLPLTYLLQFVIFNEVNNYITYIGMVLVVGTAFLTYLDKYLEKDDTHEYTPIENKDSNGHENDVKSDVESYLDHQTRKSTADASSTGVSDVSVNNHDQHIDIL